MATLALYRGATALAVPAIVAFLAWRRLVGKEDAARIGERRGIASLPRPEGPVVWVHAASVGEAQSALALIERLTAILPAAHVLVTTGTVSSARLLAERLPERALHQFVPVDRRSWVRAFLAHWRPSLALWIESELWPNLVLETAARGIPMVLVNARMSERSFANWRRWPGIVGPLLERFRRVLAQSELDGSRYRSLGASDVVVTGSLKYDAATLPVDAHELAHLAAAIGHRPRWLAASTHAGEEGPVAEALDRLKALHPHLLTILVPRHPARGEEVRALLASHGLAVAQRSRGEPIAATTDVYLADTMGELGLFFGLAPIVFMGGSLIPHGGQNLLEPARFGCALFHGPHVANFRAIASELAAAGAAEEVRDGAALAAAVDRLIADEAMRMGRGAAAKRVAEAGRGVLDAVIASLEPELAPLEAPRETGIASA
ncbi:MAG TPA: 3-deoxy-D-manno-octulosonic acid transferase [Alphaproteobacteria bacterium]|nr:3-deoxy-D-manno-octulosonic acid transferase [Alphaproteobacteria bacterium]